MRKCFIHIGTHKTGTTSIQMMLDGHRPELARHGYSYPRSGIPRGHWGHHNIAWQLGRDARFSSDAGSLDDLLDEIARSDDHIILSSEDLESTIYDPAGFGTLVQSLRQCGLEVAVVVYFRDQSAYAVSLYRELLKHGFSETFNEFIGHVLEHRAVRWKSWVFGFCYSAFLKRLPPDVGVHARAYDRASSVLPDFTSLLGLTPGDLNVPWDLRENLPISTSAAFLAFYRNRTGRGLEVAARAILPMIERDFDGAEIELASQNKERVMAAFLESNRIVESRYGISALAGMATPQGPPAVPAQPRLEFETIFSDATIALMDEVARKLAQEQGARRPGSAAALN
jgi:hypothetical protein